MAKGMLFLMVGAPGCGKSTYLNKYHYNDIIVSRDDIRFSLINEGEDYFFHEAEVYREFVSTIKYNLLQGKNVYADATHLTVASRRKLIKQLKECYSSLGAIVIKATLKECLERNAKREGLRKVPDDVVKSMYSSYEEPTSKEGFDIIEMIKRVDSFE